MNREDAALTFAKSVIATRYEDIPADAIEVTKQDILDTLGTALAGSQADGIGIVRELVFDWGGKPECTIIADGRRVPAPAAAWLNGTMAHARDFDDTHDVAAVHAGVTVVPACLAIAERRGGVTGKEFVTAVALGIDLSCRLGLGAGAAPPTSGFHSTSLFGIFGATAACGKLLGLDLEKMINALGIAYSQCAGSLQVIVDSALTKRMHAGFAAKGAVLSAILAEKGYTGPKNIFEGKYGLFNIYFQGKHNRSVLLKDLGKDFEVRRLSFKPYSACRLSHTSAGAAIKLVSRYDIKPEQIDHIVAYEGRLTQVCCEPLEVRQNPKTVVDAQFSVPYVVARAVMQRKLSLRDFTQEAVVDKNVARMARKVEPRLSPELTTESAVEPAIIEVKLTDGRVYQEREDYALGSPENPMSWDDLVAKFHECASYSVKKVDEKSLVQRLRNLEKIKDMQEIIKLF